MLVVLVIHDVKPGRLDRARRRIDGNTDQMATQPGLVFRHTGTVKGMANRIVTITGWQRPEDRAAWDAIKRSLPSEIAASEVFEKVESFAVETYDERWGSELVNLDEGRR